MDRHTVGILVGGLLSFLIVVLAFLTGDLPTGLGGALFSIITCGLVIPVVGYLFERKGG